MLALTGLGVLPAAAPADPTGGSAAASGSGGSGPRRAGNPSVSGGAQAGESPSGGLAVPATALLGATVRFRGDLGAGGARRLVLVERYSASKARWVLTARTRATRRGTFSARWRTNEAGRFALRARVASGSASGARAPGDGASARLTVYRPSLATWYGPGFYGQRTACGQRLTRGLVGVANRTLPCGTMVEVSYQGRTLTVPVIDRGPYSSASWDLTGAAARALRFSGRDRIGTLIAAPGGSGSASPPGTAARSRRRLRRR